MSNNPKTSSRRLKAAAEEVRKLDELLAMHRAALTLVADNPATLLMIRQYEHLRRERYADYLQEFFSLHLHQKGFLPVLQELSTRILSDETESADIPEVRKTFEILLKAS